MRFFITCLVTIWLCGVTFAQDKPITLVVLGDSISATQGLPPGDALPVKLEQALSARGHNVHIINAGVSGDTLKGGLARFDWVVQPDAQGLIIELGGNDLLRGIDPDESKKALFEILHKAQQRGIPVLLTGLRAFSNFGADYARRFEAIYVAASTEFDILLHADLLKDVAANPKLNQTDGIHPNAKGISVIVAGLLPKTEQLLQIIRARN